MGATVASLFWMTVNYIRYNYDHRYIQLDDDGVHDRPRDVDQQCVEDGQRK